MQSIPKTAIVILNYNGAEDTIACLQSLVSSGLELAEIHVVDNASGPEDVSVLSNYVRTQPGVRFHENKRNLGFAVANNLVLEDILKTGEVEQVLLLNNDTIVTEGFLRALVSLVDYEAKTEMVAARMLRFDAPDEIDNLGLTLFKSGFSLLRRTPEQPLVGPCAGCGLYTANLLRTLLEKTGHLFDPDFFMYSEDLDLALRATLLGFRSAYAPEARVLHKGASSTGGPLNDFVLYHNYRNSLFVIVKNFPCRLVGRLCGWILLMQVLVLLKYTIKWSLRPVLREYRDFFFMFPAMLRRRKRIQGCRVLSSRELRVVFSKEFYDPDYIGRSKANLWSRDLRKSSHPVYPSSKPGDLSGKS